MICKYKYKKIQIQTEIYPEWFIVCLKMYVGLREREAKKSIDRYKKTEIQRSKGNKMNIKKS